MLTPDAHQANEQSIDIEQASSTSGSVIAKAEPSISWKNWLNLVAYGINTTITYSSLTGIFGATNTEISNKYQTLVTPSGWAFSIWGPIFIWEGVFVVAQFFPRFRDSTTVLRVSPWWWALCVFQSLWTVAFAQDWITLGLILMLSILASLLGISWSTDGQYMSAPEYFLLRAPFSLQLGWIIVASTLNVNVQADASKASQETLLALAVLSYAVLLAVVTAFTGAVKSPDPIVGVVATWAFLGIYAALGDGSLLEDPSRFNPSIWDRVILNGLQKAALGAAILSATMAVVATSLRIYSACRNKLEIEEKSPVAQ